MDQTHKQPIKNFLTQLSRQHHNIKDGFQKQHASLFPEIKSINRYKKKKNALTILHNKAEQMQARLKKLEREQNSNCSSLLNISIEKNKGQKQNQQSSSLFPLPRKNSFHSHFYPNPYQQMYQQPPQIQYQPNYYSQFMNPLNPNPNYYQNPAFNQNYNNFDHRIANRNTQNDNTISIRNRSSKHNSLHTNKQSKSRHSITKSFYQSQQKNKIPQQRLKYLRKKLKIFFISIFFIFIFKTYSKIVTYKKYQKLQQIQSILFNTQTFNNIINNQLDTYDLYNTFYQICKNVEPLNKNKKHSVVITYQNEQMIINLKASQLFIQQFLDKILQSQKSGNFKQLNYILTHLISGSYPLSNIFLQKQLQLLNINQIYGNLNISIQLSKLFIINLFFIKFIIYSLLCKQQIINIVKKIYKNNYQHKKFVELYAKKLTITFVLLYQSLNNIFFESIKKQSKNYKNIPQNLKVTPAKQLIFNQNYQQQQQQQNKQKHNQKHLISNVYCNFQLKQIFIQGFQSNWKKIKHISDIFYHEAVKQHQSLIKNCCQQAITEFFPKRQILENIVNRKIYEVSQNSEDNKSHSTFHDRKNDKKKTTVFIKQNTKNTKNSKKTKKPTKK